MSGRTSQQAAADNDELGTDGGWSSICVNKEPSHMRVYDKLQDRFISVTKLGVQRGDTTCNRDTTFVFMDRLFAAHLYIFPGGQWPCGAPAVGLDVLLPSCGASRGAGVLVFASLIDDSSASEPVDTWWVFDIDEAEERRSLLDANDNHQQTFKTRNWLQPCASCSRSRRQLQRS